LERWERVEKAKIATSQARRGTEGKKWKGSGSGSGNGDGDGDGDGKTGCDPR
jgi:hypothetical protein